MNDQPMFDVISGMFGLISGMFGLNRSSIEQGIRYSCYPLVVVFNILSWYRFHCRGMTKHLFNHCLKTANVGSPRSRSSDAKAKVVATPAEGPSLGIAPRKPFT